MKKIYLIRHGQTQFNLEGIVQGGRVNSSLNETGIKQSKAFYDAYKNEPFDAVYTSKLNRSIESVQAFIDQGIAWESREGLNEISWGDYDGKKITNDDYYWGIVKRWHEGETSLRSTNGESPEDVALRQKPVIQEIIDSPHKHILVCMHGRAMRILLAWMTDQAIVEMQNFPHHNLGLYILNWDGNKFCIEATNKLDHLEEAGLVDQNRKYN